MIHLEPNDAHNARLVANVHPADWINPEPLSRYHLVILGGGTAGLVCAAGAAGLGARVALIERHLLGGDCLNYGCVPSKALLRSAKAMAQVRKANRFGIQVPEGVQVDFGAVMERLRRLRADLSPHDSAQRFRELGVDLFLGEGKFTGPDRIEVANATLHFRKAVIATGGRAAAIAIPGIETARYLTNETIFSLTQLPARLAVIGAGPIGCELAQAMARLGSQVTLLDTQPQILPREDPDAADRIARALRGDGVDMRLGNSIQQIERSDHGTIVRFHDSKHAELVVDQVLLAAGRQPNVEGLNLKDAGVRFHPQRGIEVDNSLRTSNRHVYAAGDVCSRYQFTHAADAMARLVLRNALFPGSSRVSALTIPWCTFTDPEIARVGLSEQEAREQGIAHAIFVQPFHEVDRAVIDGETDGFVKILVAPKSDRILGATIVAADAGNMIAEITMAMTQGIGLAKIGSIIHPYPTQAEAIKKLGDAYQRTRLTPIVKFLMQRWLAWNR